MSFRGQGARGNKTFKIPRIPGASINNTKILDEKDDHRFDLGKRRPPPFGRGRRVSPPGTVVRPRNFGGYGRGDPHPMRDRSPLDDHSSRLDDPLSEKYKKDNRTFSKHDDLDRKDMGKPLSGDKPPRDRPIEGRSRFDGPGNFNSRLDDSYKSRPITYPSTGNTTAPPTRKLANVGFPQPNECEVIAVSKQQRNYAETVETRIKKLGLLVDVLFLKDEALLTQTIEDLGRRGTLFAMVINPQNETHGSVTINILYGIPQEHRNMPLADSLDLIASNYHEHIRKQKENLEHERAKRGPYTGPVPATREIQFLLSMLADGRWVSMAEITDVIQYLSERRDQMKATSGGDHVPYKPNVDPDIVEKKKLELQQRILDLMNQIASPVEGTQVLNPDIPNRNLPPVRPDQSRMSPSPNNVHSQAGFGSSGIPGLKSNTTVEEEELAANDQIRVLKSKALAQFTAAQAAINDAKVQKALNNLLQNGPNLLKNISMASSNAPPTGNAQKPGPNIPGFGSSNEHMGMQGGNREGLAQVEYPKVVGRQPNMPSGDQMRGSGNMDIGPPRGQQRGAMSHFGGLGPQRSAGNLSDLGGPGSQRVVASMAEMGHSGGMSNLIRPGSEREKPMGMESQSVYGTMSSMNPGRGFNSGGGRISESGMGGPGMSDLERMMGPPPGIDSNRFSGANQYGSYQGGPRQQSNFGGSYSNLSNIGNNLRHPYDGPPGMSSGSYRY